MQMKNIIFILFSITSISTSCIAQHSISIKGGMTISNLQKYGNEQALKDINLYYDGMFNTTPFYNPYLSLEYAFDYKPFRISSGLSLLSLGANNFIEKNSSTGKIYLTIPLLIGRKWRIVNNFSITAEIGGNFGLKILNIGDVELAKSMDRIEGDIGITGGLETSWKKIKLGTKLQIGLTNYFDWTTQINNNTQRVDFRHSSITFYIGYTLWSSTKNKIKN